MLKIGKSDWQRAKELKARERKAERLDGRAREGESIMDYQRRVMGEIQSLDWSESQGGEAELSM